MAEPARVPAPPRGADLAALEAVSAAVEAGAGLPAVLRAVEQAIDASLVLADSTGRHLAVAARSPADEHSLTSGGGGVQALELRVGDELVGRLLMRVRGAPPPPVILSLIRTLLAAEVERVRAPERASEEAVAALVHALLTDEGVEPAQLRRRAAALGADLDAGGSVVVARALPLVPTEEDWGARVLAVAGRGAQAAAPSALAAPAHRPDARAGEVVVV